MQETQHNQVFFSHQLMVETNVIVRDARGFLYMMTSSNGNIFRVTGPLCGEFTGPGEFPTQRPVTRSFDVLFDLRLNKRLSKQPWGWWFETPARSLWRQRNGVRKANIGDVWPGSRKQSRVGSGLGNESVGHQIPMQHKHRFHVMYILNTSAKFMPWWTPYE